MAFFISHELVFLSSLFIFDVDLNQNECLIIAIDIFGLGFGKNSMNINGFDESGLTPHEYPAFRIRVSWPLKRTTCYHPLLGLCYEI